jgi:hypothetical protein
MLAPHQLAPNPHALRLIKRSAARHKVCKVRHASSWNSRPVTPKKKFKNKNLLNRRKNQRSVEQQPHEQSKSTSSKRNNSTTNGPVKRQRAPKAPSFEDMLRSDVPLRRRTRKKAPLSTTSTTASSTITSTLLTSTTATTTSTATVPKTAAATHTHRHRGNKNTRSVYARSTSNSRTKNHRRGGSSWTRTGMKTTTTTGPSRAKVASIARKTQRPELRAKSAPSSDNKRANSRTRARALNQRKDCTSTHAGNSARSLLVLDTAANNDKENVHDTVEQSDPLATTHHNFGTIDTTLLDARRPTAEEETPGGVWGDGVGLDLSTILECSVDLVESQSVASFLSPASQKLMQAHLKTRTRKDNGVDSNDDTEGGGSDSDDSESDSAVRSTSGVRRSSSFTSGMTTFFEEEGDEDDETDETHVAAETGRRRPQQISPEELAGGWRVFHQEVDEENEKKAKDADEESFVNHEQDIDDCDVVEMRSTELFDREEELEQDEEDEEDEQNEIMIDECVALSPQHSEPSSVLDEVADTVSNVVGTGSNDEYDEYDEDSFAESEYSADEFDSEVEIDDDDNKLNGIASDLKQLSTLAPGEFENLLGVLRES